MQGSDRFTKHDILDVRQEEILAQVDDRHLAPLDAAGVSLAPPHSFPRRERKI
jgi:hypothetical protein